MTRHLSIEELREQVSTTRPQRRDQLARAETVLAEHPEAVLIECADENTGQRFGRADCRRGQCRKIGGARQPLWYQLWASWAPRDIEGEIRKNSPRT